MAARAAALPPNEPLPWARRLLRDAGLGLCVVLGLLAAVACLSFDPADPSANVASTTEVSNWLGGFGATLADVLIQFTGLLALPLALAGAGLCLALLMKGPGGLALGRARWAAAAGCALLLAMAGSGLPRAAGWPMGGGFGGLIGDWLLGLFAAPLSGAPGGRGVMAVLAFLGALACAAFALRLRMSDLAATGDRLGYLWATVRVGWDDLSAKLSGRSRRKPVPRRAASTARAASSPHGRTATPATGEDDTAAIARRFAPEAVPSAGAFDDFAPEPAPWDEEATADIPVELPKPRREGSRAAREAQPELPIIMSRGGFELPRLDLLARPPQRVTHHDEAALKQNARLLMTVLNDFGVRGEILNVRPGPVVTLYELEPAAGVKSARVIGLADDIARSMSAVACRVAVVPGRNAIGIELPNARRETVFLRGLLSSSDYEGARQELPLALGETIGGEPAVADLAKMPHLLIAGTTGSGKSVGINAMILSLLYKLRPDQCRFIMIDPKMLELSVYQDIPHLLAPVVTDPKKAVAALKWTVREMEERYRKMSKIGVRNIAGYNQRASEAQSKGEHFSRKVQTGWDRQTGQPVFETESFELDPMPFIVVVIDEMADLMLVAGKDIEGAVQRLAQMARAAGIHLIMATQRPSVDVITGTIKANFPTRISYSVTSKIDSRTILGEQGAEQLLGQGDLLFMAGGGRIKRLHGPFVSDGEVEAIVAALKAQGAPDYFDEITEDPDDEDGDGGGDFGGNMASGDDLFDQAVAIVARDRKASTSYLQRKLKLGYNRAATLIERMEREGMITSPNHAGKREILLPEHN